MSKEGTAWYEIKDSKLVLRVKDHIKGRENDKTLTKDGTIHALEPPLTRI